MWIRSRQHTLKSRGDFAASCGRGVRVALTVEMDPQSFPLPPSTLLSTPSTPPQLNPTPSPSPTLAETTPSLFHLPRGRVLSHTLLLRHSKATYFRYLSLVWFVRFYRCSFSSYYLVDVYSLFSVVILSTFYLIIRQLKRLLYIYIFVFVLSDMWYLAWLDLAFALYRFYIKADNLSKMFLNENNVYTIFQERRAIEVCLYDFF